MQPRRARLRLGRRARRVGGPDGVAGLGRRRRDRVPPERHQRRQRRRPADLARPLLRLLHRPRRLPDDLLLHEEQQAARHFSKVLLISSVLCSLNYGLTAALGYIIYGDDVQSQVTLNLPSGKLYTKVAVVTTLINPLAKYALLVAPMTAAIEERFSLLGSAPARVSISTVVVVSTAIVACTVPFFGYLMSFIGSLLSVMATVIFPCLCFLRIHKAEGIRRAEIAAIAGIMMAGVFVAVTGTYTSLQQIIGAF
ncbi:hypothetical protein ACP70R_037771 [Stipagrostis hirtigluma subsp. patula]